ELYQRLRMLRDKRDRRDHDGNTVAAGSAQFLFDRGPEPGQWSNSALIADSPIGSRLFERGAERRRGAFDLLRVGIALADDLQRQAMGAQQQPDRYFLRRRFSQAFVDQPSHGGD